MTMIYRLLRILKQQRRCRVEKFAVAREAIHRSENEGIGGPDHSGDDGRRRGWRYLLPTQFERLEEDVSRGTTWGDAAGGCNRIVNGMAPVLQSIFYRCCWHPLRSRRRVWCLQGGAGQCRQP